MRPRQTLILLSALTISLLTGCGGSGSGGSNGGGGTSSQDFPTLASIAPSRATSGSPSIALSLFGSNFASGATAQWNGVALSSTWVSASQMTATIPAGDLSAPGSAQLTVVNPGGITSAAQTFTVSAASSGSTWARTVMGISSPNDIAWDSVHGNLYVSVGSTDPAIPNTIVPINPFTGIAGSTIEAGNNPDLLSISSDSSYLWAGLDGGNSVQRFLLPSLTKDVSFALPLDLYGNAQQAVSLEAAPAAPHTVAVIPGHWGWSPPGDGVYVYDDATQRPNHVLGGEDQGPYIDWIQWGANDSTIYGNQYTTIDQGGVATLNVTSSGVSFVSYNGGQVGPAITHYDSSNGVLYSSAYAAAFNPVNGSQLGMFNVPNYDPACTVDASLNRYFCFVAIPIGDTDVSTFELWVFDINTFVLLQRVYFGVTHKSPITGAPSRLVRWGNAGLALVTTADLYLGSAGIFLIDGAAVNPNVLPDSSSGTPAQAYSWMTSLSPQQAPAGSGDITVTITGKDFTQTSTACWSCNYLQLQFLPTSYVSSTQLSVRMPASLLAGAGPLPISIYDSGSSLFSSNSLAFTVGSPGVGTTQVRALNLAGMDEAWDAVRQLLYVGAANYDGAYPNAIVGLDPTSATVTQAQNAAPDPAFLNLSANAQYLYVAAASATEMTQLQLPGLSSPLTWTLSNPASSAVYWAGDMKAAPISSHTTAVTLFNQESDPAATGGVVIFDDNVERPDFAPGWGQGPAYVTLAWSSSDQLLAGASASGPLYQIQVSQLGASLAATGSEPFNQGDIHSDFGTGLIYSDDGNVADPTTQAIVGTYSASGLVAPDSSLNRVFILGQTASQAGTNNYTINSFNEALYTPVSSITLTNLLGPPIKLVRWGTSGLAILTVNQNSGPAGMLYVIQDTGFVSGGALSSSTPQELVQLRWKRSAKADLLKKIRQGKRGGAFPARRKNTKLPSLGPVGVPIR